MKKLLIIILILMWSIPSYAATIGGPEISIPEESWRSRKEAIEMTLDRYDYMMNIKGTAEMEFVLERKLSSADDSIDMELEGQTYMLKISDNFYDIFEPYIKIGTSDLEVKWHQHGKNVTVKTEPGLVWAAGAKIRLYEFKDYGVKLTLDTQYRNFNLDVDSTSVTPSKSENFEINEWEFSLLASKKFILPVGMRDYYIVPYGGITYTSSDIDVSFIQSTTEALYSTYNACDENVFGLVLGCDVMPSLLSWYLFNFELRLFNETALSFGGTVKF